MEKGRYQNGVMLLDGAMGTMLQRRGLSGDSDMFNLSAPEVVRSIHEEYIAAGADMIETNTFGANRISQAEYGESSRAAEMAFAGARLAREAADKAGRRVLVAGSMGPTSKSLSMGTDAEDPSWRPVGFDEMAAAFGEQIEALARGGVDLILIETSFDALNVKAALYSYEQLCAERRIPRLPVMISASCADRSGRTLTGQTLEAFFTAIRHCKPFSFGLNCSLGAAEIAPLMEQTRDFGTLISCYPNAGLPNEMGEYDQSPEEMAEAVMAIVRSGNADIVGGCCGTTPEHIRAIRERLDAEGLRWNGELPSGSGSTRTEAALEVSGLEKVLIDVRRNNFTNIGERTNVAGSRKFARLIAEGNYAEAMGIAARQIENGASVIDINMDDAMLDGAAEMEKFVRMIQTEPAVAKAALMIDSSDWNTVLAGLKNAQGKCIVNSISLKEGESEFLRKALEIKALGAAIVVMAFDEEGQATDFAHKTRVCERAYRLLTDAGIEPSEIIFDVNVLSVGTGTGTDRKYAVDFIEAVRWIKRNLPGALTSGGISNLSFAFRGNNPVREAMHSVFLYHAIEAGLDMAIVNPGMLRIYDDIEPQLREAVEDVILDRRDDAAERLLEIAQKAKDNAGREQAQEVPAETDTDPQQRLRSMIIKGLSEGLEDCVMKVLGVLGEAGRVIEGPLMEGMEQVGAMFADGRMFLPQVVKSARVMKDAVAVLQPYLDAEAGSKCHAENTAKTRPTVVIATVQGDVHDIGKDITATVLSCNGFNVINLGVMVPKETILEEAERHDADIIAVSGLITPSLAKMEDLCREMTSRGMQTPLLIGGATTNALHTAVKLAPLYGHVFHGADASASAVLALRLMSQREETEIQEHAAQEKLRRLHEEAPHGHRTGGNGKLFAYLGADGFLPEDAADVKELPVQDIPVGEVAKHIDWRTFYSIWGIKAEDWSSPQAREARAEAEKVLESLDCRISAAVHWMDGGQARSHGIDTDAPLVGCFAASVRTAHGNGCACEACRDLMATTLRLTLADAASEWIGSQIQLPEGYGMILPAVGYPSCPDHSLKKAVLEAIPDSQELGITLTESWAMIPQASVCGFIIIHKEAKYL